MAKCDPYPDIEADNLQELLAEHLEFRNLKNNENLYPHQEFVRRYMSPYTPYKSLLMFHSLGSGKSRACIAVAVDHYLHDKKKCIIFTKGKSGANNFEKEIELYKSYTSVDMSVIFSFKRYIKFSNDIKKMSPENIKTLFSNTILVLDEIHNVRYIKNISEESVYKSILKVLEYSTNIKIIVATATPMIDNPTQIDSILGICNFFRSDKKSYKGIVSYNNVILQKPVTEKVGDEKYIENIIIYPSYMQGYQYDEYKKLYNKTERFHNDIYREDTHVALFCFDDGTHGRAITSENNKMDKIKTSEEKFIRYKIKPEYEYLFEMDNLRMCSSKYHKLLEDLKSSTGNVFVFLEEVKGSGLLLLASILEYHGYLLYKGEDLTTLQKTKRYTLCVGSLDICPNITERLDGFNSSDNKHGDYVRILLGSKVIGESITLKNVRHFHCLTPHWNDSTIDQAVGRVVRNNSHVDLEVTERNVKIYIHASIYEPAPDKSIDIIKLQRSHIKEQDKKNTEKQLIQYSIEKYCLDDTVTIPIKYVNNFAAAYVYNCMDDIKEYITNLFNDNKIVSIESVCQGISLYNGIINNSITVIQEALCRIIYYNIRIHNKYVRSWKNIIFLVDDVKLPYVMLPPIHIPVLEYHENTITTVSCDSDNFIRYFRTLSVTEKKDVLENAVLNRDKNILPYIKHTLVIQMNDTVYHLLMYRDLTTSYNCANPVPKKALGKTRKLENRKWKYVVDPKEEEEVFDNYKNYLSKLFKQLDKDFPIYGIISTIDNDMRLRMCNNDTEYTDNRYVHRGKNMKSIKKNILENIWYDLTKEKYSVINIQNLVSKIDNYMVDNNLFIIL